jgi:serine/threonine protein kinase
MKHPSASNETVRSGIETQKLALDVMDRNAFALLLRRSGLLKERQIENSLQKSQAGDRAIELAQLLVKEGQLTPFQASELLAGRYAGFILGPYRILERIDRGGMGNVFKALHTVMNREVALKAIPVDLISERRTRLQFRQEIRTAAQLNHPHIVSSYDANRVGSIFYLVMELVHGPNLLRLVQEQGRIPPALGRDLLRQAAEALEHAHDLGITHCDIKPANLLVANAPGWHGHELPPAGVASDLTKPRRPALKILDFGIARMRGLSSNQSQVHSRKPEQHAGIYGTPDFVAPEQAHDLSKADARSDLYSLGCTFYYALAGQVPFPGESSLEKLIKHLSEEPAPLERFCPEIPPIVAAAIRKLMAKHPSDRFQSAAELIQALATEVLTGGAVPVAPVPAPAGDAI